MEGKRRTSDVNAHIGDSPKDSRPLQRPSHLRSMRSSLDIRDRGDPEKHCYFTGVVATVPIPDLRPCLILPIEYYLRHCSVVRASYFVHKQRKGRC